MSASAQIPNTSRSAASLSAYRPKDLIKQASDRFSLRNHPLQHVKYTSAVVYRGPKSRGLRAMIYLIADVEEIHGKHGQVTQPNPSHHPQKVAIPLNISSLTLVDVPRHLWNELSAFSRDALRPTGPRIQGETSRTVSINRPSGSTTSLAPVRTNSTTTPPPHTFGNQNSQVPLKTPLHKRLYMGPLQHSDETQTIRLPPALQDLRLEVRDVDRWNRKMPMCIDGNVIVYHPQLGQLACAIYHRARFVSVG